MKITSKMVKTPRINHQRLMRGFTLTELMIVVAIVAILAAVGYPSYMDSVRKGNRTEAKTELMALSQQLERCMSLHGSYKHADCPDFPYTTKPKGMYTISATTLTDSAFTLSAAPATGSAQSKDTDCAKLEIDNTGDKTAKKSSDVFNTKCW
jgi:type IV pilus assembly protein PilE